MAIGFPQSETSPTGVQMIPSTSEAIAAYGYDAARQELYILPRSRARKVYIYAGVTPAKMAEFLSADSMGQYWNLSIKPYFPVRN